MKHKSIGWTAVPVCLIAVAVAEFTGQRTPPPASATVLSPVSADLLTILSNAHVTPQNRPIPEALSENPIPPLTPKSMNALMDQANGNAGLDREDRR
ncbi:MAG: hypothetical protein ABSB42_07890 [Tepidisphaeraceae bacterium]|jgi:hypothetical protein